MRIFSVQLVAAGLIGNLSGSFPLLSMMVGHDERFFGA